MKRPILAAFGVVLVFLFCVGSSTAQVQVWGWNGWGQLSQGPFIGFFPTPVTIPGVTDSVGVAGGWANTMVIKSDGTMMAAGYNNFGSIGNGTLVQQNSAVPVLNVTNIVQASGGTAHAGALRGDGRVYMWGSNQDGQIGSGGFGGTVPSPVLLNITDVVQLDLGDRFSLALKSDGTVWSWGRNNTGQLGDGTATDRSNPVQVGVGIPGFTNIVAIAAGADFGIALKSDRTIWLWGNNGFAQLGNGTATGTQPSPAVHPVVSNVIQISAGDLHVIVLKSDGSVWTWGFNREGQAANGASGGNQSTPVQRGGLSNVASVVAGGAFNLVLRRDGSVWSWGKNFSGALGAGFRTTNNACFCEVNTVQTMVGNGNVQVATGVDHGIAIKPSFTTPAGSNVLLNQQTIRLNFDSVTTPGTTAYSTIDPTTTGLNLPANYTLDPTSPGYEVTTTAATTGNIEVCFKVSEPDPVRFATLRVLHGEGLNFVDRTIAQTPTAYAKQLVCGRVTSFSPFVIATGFVPTAANVSVSGRVLTSQGRGIGGVRVSATNSSGETLTVSTNTFGNYRFDELAAGQTYIFTVRSKRYEFAQASQVVFVSDNLQDMNFTALPEPGSETRRSTGGPTRE